jgi:hypothetical protein
MIYIGRASDVASGVRVFDPAAEYDAFDGRLRVPALSTDGLLRVIGEGTCLEPHIHDGDTLYFDATLPPEDGDFVLTFWPPHELAAAYSRPVLPLLTKWFRIVGGYPLLLCHDGARPLRDQKILGVLRRIERQEISSAQ